MFDLIEVSTFLRSVQSISDSSIPILVVHCRNNLLVPPYKSFILTRWSPALSRKVIAVVAASPEENTNPERNTTDLSLLGFLSLHDFIF